MSIKTPKRLVIGVIASLVFAPFAAIAPASAATGDFTVVTANSSAGTAAKRTATQVAGPNNFVDVTVEVVANTQYAIGVAGGTATSTTAGVTGSGTSNLNVNISGTSLPLRIPTPTQGTITVSVYTVTAGAQAATALSTLTITVGATSTIGAVDPALSTSLIRAASTWDTITVDEVVSVSRTASDTPVAAIRVALAQVNGSITSTTAVSASVSGPGILILSTSATNGGSPIGTGRSLSSTIATTGETFYVFVRPDGNSGVATVTITAGAFTATETITFFGAVASYTVVANKAHIANDNASVADVIRVTALDASGVKVSGATVHASVGTSTIGTIDASAVTDATGVAKFGATGLTNKFGAVPVTFGNAATAATVTATGSFGVASPRAASIAVTANKTSYLPGELMTLTFTANDANGLGLPNGTYAADTLLANSATNPLVSMGLTSTPFAGNTDLALKAGVVTATAYAPLVEGPLNFSWTVAGTAGGAATNNLAAALLGTKVTLTVTVAKPVVPVVVVYDKPTLSFVKNAGRIILSGTAVDGEGDIIIYVKKVGTTAWKERAKTLEVAAPGDFNGSIKAPKGNVLIRVKQEGTGLFSNQIIVVK
jgi:hypothetical protein